MKIMVFRFWHNGHLTPLTVFAESLESAQNIRSRWAVAHQGENSTTVIKSEICESGWLDDRPLWKHAVERCKAGVGRWLGHHDGWAIEEPETAPRGPLGPPDTPVRMFAIEADGCDAPTIFAMDEFLAAAIYQQWLDQWDRPMPKSYTIRRLSRWMLTGPETGLREDMDARVSGIGSWSDAEGWRIFPPSEKATAG